MIPANPVQWNKGLSCKGFVTLIALGTVAACSSEGPIANSSSASSSVQSSQQSSSTASSISSSASSSSAVSGSSSSSVASSSVSSSVSSSAASSASSGSACGGGVQTVALDLHITVDQFGYLPGDSKVAVIRNPKVGFDAALAFTPGTSYQVRRSGDGCVVMTGAPVVWNGGAVEMSSGDQGWWFDFSSVSTPDSYFVYDVARNVRSPVFSISQGVYKNVLKAAVRMYFYQRSGFAKPTLNAGTGWADGAAYLGPNQDTQARDITDQTNLAKVKDVSGGWFDAGDTNKYVTFAVPVVHQLLLAYQNHSSVFTDDFNIPESGNGIPDVVDEVKWEVDWLKKMQDVNSDGSVALKVGTVDFNYASPPSADFRPRYYVPSCTSGTIAAAGMFAHASIVFNGIAALNGESNVLKDRAIRAWNNYQSNAVKRTDCDSQVVQAGDADLSVNDQSALQVVAAIYLYAATGDATFNDFVKSHYRDTVLRSNSDIGWTRYNPEHGEALLFYTTLANADTAVKADILSRKGNDVAAGNQVYRFTPGDDLYRAFMHSEQYHWGSNMIRANYGNSNVDVVTYGLAGTDAASYRSRALEILHYFHGVNPFGMVYLTNMYSYGATNSANAIFHTWFSTGSPIWSKVGSSTYGPAPGYVPGGPNKYTGVTLSPPAGQPEQKAYRDWNGNGSDPQISWEITEPGIYYQAAYVKLLSTFAN